MTVLRPLLAALLVALPLAVRAEAPVFTDYDTLRARMDALVMARRLSEALVLFGARDAYTDAELAEIDTRVRGRFPADFENAAMVRSAEMLNGFRQEMIAYWTGKNYLYVYLFLHQRPGEIVAMQFRFSTDVDEVFARF